MAVLYFDWDNGNDGNAGTEASPKKDISQATLSGIAAVFLRAGQIHKPAARTTGQSNFIMDRYGSETANPIISAEDTAEQKQVITFNNKNNIVIRNLHFKCNHAQNASTSAVSIFFGSTAMTSVLVDNCDFSNVFSGVGLNIGGVTTWTPATGKSTGIVVKNSRAFNCANHGINIGGPVSGAIIDNCHAINTGTNRTLIGFGGWGIYQQGLNEKYDDDAGWTQVSVPNNVWEITQTNAWAAQAVHVGQWFNITGMTSGWLTEGTFDALNENEWAIGDANATLQIRLSGSGDPTTESVHVVHEWNSNSIIRNCTSSKNLSVGGTGGDGNGIGFDQGSESCLILNCISYNNTGSGFSIHKSKSCTLVGNLAYDNDYYGIRTNQGHTGHTLYNNTCVNNTEAQLHNRNSGTSFTWTAKNNIAVGGNDGINYGEAGSTTIDTITENNNIIYGATEAVHNSRFTLDSSDLTTDPKLVSPNYITHGQSLGQNAGEYVAGIHDTYNTSYGIPYKNPPDIGIEGGGLDLHRRRIRLLRRRNRR